MLNHDVDDLTKELQELRLERAEAIENLQRINNAEIATLRKIEAAKAIGPKERTCNFAKGDILRITNHLRDEHGKVGTVTHVGKTLITIRNSGTKAYYKRAWWNLEIIETAAGTCPDKRRGRN